MNATTVDVSPSSNIINSKNIMFRATITHAIISRNTFIKIIIPPQFVMSTESSFSCSFFVGMTLSPTPVCSQLSEKNAILLSGGTDDSNYLRFSFGLYNHIKFSNYSDPFLFTFIGENGEETVSSQAQFFPHNIDGTFNFNYFLY